jgi:segregation and condensation protein B
VRTLFERNWIRVVGHREVPGRPELLGTTRDFLDYFGLRSLDDLPTLAELRDMDNLGVQLELPGQEGDAQRVDAILTGDAADDEMAAPADDDGAEDDEESGTGSPQASGLVARQSDD